MKLEIKALIRFVAAIICCLFSCNCMTATGPNGEKFAMTLSSTGFTTNKITESKSKANPIPLLGGGYNNDDLTEAKEATQMTSITVGDIHIEGVIDQGTPVDATLGWAYRITRAVVTGQVFKTGINGYFGNANAKVAADVAKTNATTASKTTLGLAKERANLIPQVNPELVPIQALKSP